MTKIKYVLIIVSIIVLAIAGLVYFFEPIMGENSIFGNFAGPQSSRASVINLTYETLPEFLMSSSFVEDLPKNALVILEIGEESYVIRKDSVEPGKIEGADMKIYLPVGYLETIGKEGLCDTVAIAKDNGDLWAEFYLSDFELVWKYKGMLKHEACLG